MTSCFSSDCECSNCLESSHNESDCNPCSNQSDDNDSLRSRSRQKSRPPGRRYSPSPRGPSRPEQDHRKDSACLSSEDESNNVSSQDNRFSLNPEGITREMRQLREPTVEELVRGFGDNWECPPRSMSVGRFRDQAVVRFRRALYYSGIWVTHVQGYRLEKHLSANYFKRKPGCLQRLVPWLKRELTAVYGDYSHTVKSILSTILCHMTEYDLDSESFIHLLEPYLQQHTHHFLHEFISFVHSPYDMETYDQRAMYRCSASPWAQKKSPASVPVLPLSKDQALQAQRDPRRAQSTGGQWDSERRPLSGLKQFPNGNPSLEGSESPPLPHRTACKIDAWIKHKPESGDHNSVMSPNNMLLNWAVPRGRHPSLQNCRQNGQERKTKGIPLLPGDAQHPGEGEAAARTCSSPAAGHPGEQRKGGPRESKALSPGQHPNFQKKAADKNKYSDSSPNTFRRRLPRERSLVSCKSGKRDPSWGCVSENALSSERAGRKLSSFSKKRTKCSQCPQFAEVGSHSGRRRQRPSRSGARRSKSWCVRLPRRSVSRDSSIPFLRGGHRSERFTRNVGCEPPKETSVHDCESNQPRPSSNTARSTTLPSTAGKKPKCPPKSEGASQAGSHYNHLTCLQTEQHRSSSKREMKQKTTFPSLRKPRAVRQEKNQCQCPDTQTPEEVAGEVGDLNAKKQGSRLSECAPSCRRQVQKKNNCHLQKHHQAESEQKGDKVSETQRCK